MNTLCTVPSVGIDFTTSPCSRSTTSTQLQPSMIATYTFRPSLLIATLCGRPESGIRSATLMTSVGTISSVRWISLLK